MKLTSPVERAIYGAAFVAEYQRIHEHGVHAEFRRQADNGEISKDDVVRLWEEWCADLALVFAESAVLIHRKAVRRNRAS